MDGDLHKWDGDRQQGRNYHHGWSEHLCGAELRAVPFKPNAPSDIIAGEWEMPGNSTVTAKAELTVKSVNNYNGDRTISARTKGQIDLTEYSTLQATCKASGGSKTKLEVYSGSSVVASVAIGTDLTTVTVDISALSGLHSIGFGGVHTAYATITYTATEIKLLKRRAAHENDLHRFRL